MRNALISIFILLCFACDSENRSTENHTKPSGISVLVLGNVQDAGSPHIECQKSCCSSLSEAEIINRMVSSLGLVDFDHKESYLFDATPDITRQLKVLQDYSGFQSEIPNGIFLTHAHIGHYTGLMYLGREAVSADSVPVFCMPGMHQFLESNGPWNQLVDIGNIMLKGIDTGEFKLNGNLRIQVICVPHRDEYSETIGYIIKGPNKSLLFIPDIDKWEKWQYDIKERIPSIDYALIDATFYNNEELPNRDMSEIPHPFVVETMALLHDLSSAEKNKIWFIHLNHTNPLLREGSKASKEVIKRGFHVARLGETFQL